MTEHVDSPDRLPSENKVLTMAAAIALAKARGLLEGPDRFDLAAILLKLDGKVYLSREDTIEFAMEYMRTNDEDFGIIIGVAYDELPGA